MSRKWVLNRTWNKRRFKNFAIQNVWLTQNGQVLILSKLPGQSAVWDVIQILQPFKVWNCYTTSVEIQIGNNQNIFLKQYFVTGWCNWTISTLGNDLSFDPRGIIRSNDLKGTISNKFGLKCLIYLFFGTYAEDVAFRFDKWSIFSAVICFGPWKSGDGAITEFPFF